jgi:hypothetical protein
MNKVTFYSAVIAVFAPYIGRHTVVSTGLTYNGMLSLLNAASSTANQGINSSNSLSFCNVLSVNKVLVNKYD